MKHIVSVGGGIASTLILPMHLAMLYPKDSIKLVMAKLPNEDPDVWKLCDKVEQLTGLEIEYIGLKNEDGTFKNPWDIFFDVKYLGNTRIDPCSRMLKREVVGKWMNDNCEVGDHLYVGIGAYELDRMLSIRKRWKERGVSVFSPLAEFKHIDRDWQIDYCKRVAGFIPRLYQMGFTNNNCGGACIKAGQKDWARLLFFLPDVYEWWENNEREWRKQNGEYSFLRKVENGIMRYITLEEFRLMLGSRWDGIKRIEKLVETWKEVEEKMLIDDLEESSACLFCDAAA